MSPRLALILCVLLAIVSGAVSYCATRDKSPTIDEPSHLAAAYAHAFVHDDRLEPEHPVLWKWVPALAISPSAIHFDPKDPAWREAGQLNPSRPWIAPTLFQDPSEGIRLINRARFAMMFIGIALCLATAWWAYQIAGPWAAVIAATLVSLDPNLLAHVSLIKNDVAMTLMMVLTSIALWRAGRRLTWHNALALCLACAVAINVKISAVLVPPIVTLALLVRALLPAPWVILGRDVSSRMTRLLVAPAILMLIGVAMFAVTWASYGLRFAPSSDPTLQIELHNVPPTISVRMARFAADHRLLPQAFCDGFLRHNLLMTANRNFLLGTVSNHGWWYFFPFVLLVKSPLATLAATFLALIAAIRLRQIHQRIFDPWTTACLLIPAGVYLVVAMASDLNHGVRHLLPVFPMLFVALAVVFARAIEVWRTKARVAIALLAIGLAVETLAAYPNYIAFFNVSAGGSRGGLQLLGDSNLDWGQDMNALAKWQAAHPDVKLYLAAFSAVDPENLGIRYTPLPSGYWGGADAAPPDPNQPGVLAISATILQGIYARPPWDAMYAEIRTWKPREVLGGTIYLYDFPSPEMSKYK